MSDRRIVVAIVLAAAVGVAVAGYLTYVHYADVEALCIGGSGGCEKVQASQYSKLAGVPVAVLGLAGYLLLLASLAVRGEAGRLAGATIALIGFGFSAYLTYRELFTIHAVCQWCLASAALMTALAALTTIRLMRGELEGTRGGTFAARARSKA